MEILGDVVNELLTLQLHLERLRRVRHNEGIRRGRLLHISGSDFRPFDVEGIRGSSGSQAHRSRAERVRSCVKRRRPPRTDGYLLRRRHGAGYTTQPLLWFRQTSCRGKWLHLLDGETREKYISNQRRNLCYNIMSSQKLILLITMKNGMRSKKDEIEVRYLLEVKIKINF